MKKLLFLVFLTSCVSPITLKAQTTNLRASNINNIRYATNFSGANAGAKVTAAITALPSTGGIIYASFEGAQTINSDMIGSSTKCFRLVLGAGTFSMSTSQTWHPCQIIEGVGNNNRWRANGVITTIAYTGSGQAFKVQPAMNVVYDSLKMSNIVIDGAGASGSVDGILFDGATNSGSAIEGIDLTNVTISNFPRYQIYAKGTVFDFHSYGLTVMNPNKNTAGNLIQYEGNQATKWEFYNPWMIQYTPGAWCVFAGTTATFVTNAAIMTFHGGTISGGDNVASNNNGANGIWVNGGLSIYGTNLNASEVNQPRSIGVRYTGPDGGVISPGEGGFWGTGIELGNSGNEVGGTARTGDVSQGMKIEGLIGFNNNCNGFPITCSDVHIVASGSRKGTRIDLNGDFTQSGSFGFSNSLPFILNEASNLNDVLINGWTAATGGNPTIGPMTLDNTSGNNKVGIGVSPTLSLQVRTSENNGFRLENNQNGNLISAEVVQNSFHEGQFLGYDVAQVNKLVLNGDGTAAFDTTGTASPDPSAIITINSTTKGFLPPRMTTTQRNAISSPTAGLLIYNTTIGALEYYNGSWNSIIGTTTSATAGTCILNFTFGLLQSTGGTC
jgi:hypothetical protein